MVYILYLLEAYQTQIKNMHTYNTVGTESIDVSARQSTKCHFKYYRTMELKKSYYKIITIKMLWFMAHWNVLINVNKTLMEAEIWKAGALDQS